MKIRRPRRNGLTLLDVCIVVAVLALLFSLLMPSLTSRNKRHPPRIACLNNLKQTVLAFCLWANEHDGQFPQASPNSNSTLSLAQSPQVFRHYLAMSNELVTPKILVCPADKKRITADSFDKLSNTNVSYFVGLDPYERYPHGLLSGDPNLTGGTFSKGFLRTLTKNDMAGWSESLHNRAGNIGWADGSVHQVTSTGLREYFRSFTNEQIRLAIP